MVAARVISGRRRYLRWKDLQTKRKEDVSGGD